MEEHKVYRSEDIWDRLFLVRFHTLSDMSKEYIQVIGINISGDPGYDSDIKNDWTTTWLNIDTMVEKHKRGVPIKVTRAADIAIIYDIIDQHLKRHKAMLITSLHSRSKELLTDLQSLDDFANHIYPLAKKHAPQPIDDINSPFSKLMTGQGLMPMAPMFTDLESGAFDDTYAPSNKPALERESMASLLNQKMSAFDGN